MEAFVIIITCICVFVCVCVFFMQCVSSLVFDRFSFRLRQLRSCALEWWNRREVWCVHAENCTPTGVPMQSSGVRCCMSALHLFALDRRRAIMSYKHFGSASSIKLAFDCLPEAERQSLEERAEVLRHDGALRSILVHDDPSLDVMDAAVRVVVVAAAAAPEDDRRKDEAEVGST